MTDHSKTPAGTWIVIPAFNEGRVLEKTLQDVLRVCDRVVVIDDGSSDHSEETLQRMPIHRLRHPINLGQGAALETGIRYALSCGASWIVTFDADGQMSAEDIPRLCEPLTSGTADVVLGNRFGGLPIAMPPTRRLLLKAAVVWTRLTTRLPLNDTHNGFRAMTRAVASQVTFSNPRMAHASEFLLLVARHRWRFVQIPVRLTYSEYSLKKGQSNWDVLNVLWEWLFG